MPGVVGLGVVVVVVVVDVLVTTLVVGAAEDVFEGIVAVRAASRSFSIEIGVVDGVGQPVNSVVALKWKITIKTFNFIHSLSIK